MEVSSQLHILATLPSRTKPLVAIQQEAGWATQPVWTYQRKSVAPTKIQTLDHPTHSLVTIWPEFSTDYDKCGSI